MPHLISRWKHVMSLVIRGAITSVEDLSSVVGFWQAVRWWRFRWKPTNQLSELVWVQRSRQDVAVSLRQHDPAAERKTCWNGYRDVGLQHQMDPWRRDCHQHVAPLSNHPMCHVMDDVICRVRSQHSRKLKTLTRCNKMLSYRKKTALQGALFWPKVEDWNWETIFYGHYSSIFYNCDIINLKNLSIR